MATLLCLETATTNCSVAIAIDGEIIAIREDNNNKYSHAEKLHSFIEETLAEANISKKQLEAVVVGKGPGSYTGLRIGVSAAKGLCYALDIPLISLPTLEILAQQVKIEAGFIIPMLDARRMEVYSSVISSEGEEIRSTQAEILTDNSFIEYLDLKKTYFIGDGVAKFKALCSHKNGFFIENAMPSAKDMAVLAEAKYKISDTEDVAYFEPYYLKDFMMNN